MTDFNYGFLEPEEENSFHKVRPLAVENRPLKRVIDRLISPNSQLFKPAQRESQSTEEDIALWRDEMLLEFANLESTIVKIQLLRQSNERERVRYASEKVKILNAAQQIRDNTAELKVQLEAAQQTLGLRKQYDEMTEKITSNRMLRPREDQEAALEKLAGEITDLEQESAEYKRTWAERREQFGRIVGGGRQMLAMIKDEKEEAERKEGMEGADDEQSRPGSREGMRPALSHIGTPRVDGGSNTPIPNRDDAGLTLQVPGRDEGRTQSSVIEDVGDVDMNDTAATPAFTNLTSEMEEGEAEEDENEEEVEGMDTS